MSKLKLGMVLFPDLTVLDFAGPYEVFAKADCFEILIIAETPQIKGEGGLRLTADVTIDECPDLDLLFVPGGRGINPLLTNQKFLSFLSRQGKQARYITSVCTGSLLLAAAGLLNGYKATTHWRYLDLLKMFGVQTVDERIVIDRNRITAAGVSAGIDFALSLVGLLVNEEVAKLTQLQLEYDPEPPYNAGSPRTIDKELLEKGIQKTQSMFDYRKSIIKEITQPIS